MDLQRVGGRSLRSIEPGSMFIHSAGHTSLANHNMGIASAGMRSTRSTVPRVTGRKMLFSTLTASWSDYDRIGHQWAVIWSQVYSSIINVIVFAQR